MMVVLFPVCEPEVLDPSPLSLEVAVLLAGAFPLVGVCVLLMAEVRVDEKADEEAEMVELKTVGVAWPKAEEWSSPGRYESRLGKLMSTYGLLSRAGRGWVLMEPKILCNSRLEQRARLCG